MARAPRRPTTEPRFTSDPSPEAMAFFRNKTQQPSFDWRDVWAEEHAHAFTVAKATQLEVLETIRRSVGRALAQGMTYEDFAKDLTPQLQRLGWWGQQFVTDPETGEEILAQLGSPRRLQLIYEANIRSAHAAGQWERAWRTRFALSYLLYVETTSAKPREEHLEQVGTIARIDDPYWDTWFPPNGWNCKCGVRQVSEFEAEQLGPRPPPATEMRDWLNKRTGVVEQIPVGIDPGWHRNPGKLRQSNLDELLSGALENVDPSLRAAALKDLPSSWLFRKIVAGEIDSTPGVPGFFQLPKTVDVAAPIGHFGSEITAAHGGRSGVVWLSGERMLVNPWSHVTKHQWALAPRVFDEGAVIKNDAGFLTVFRTIDGKTYRAEVALRNAMVDGTPYTGGARLNLESFQVVDEGLAHAEIAVAKAEGRLVRAEAAASRNLYELPAGAATPVIKPHEPSLRLPEDGLTEPDLQAIEGASGAIVDNPTVYRAVDWYSGNGYVPINTHLRSGGKSSFEPQWWHAKVEAAIRVIDRAIETSPILSKETVLYRGLPLEKAEIEKLSIGDIVRPDPAFQSVSRFKHFAESWSANKGDKGIERVVYVINANGARALPVFRFPGALPEGELLLARGTRYRVTKIEKFKRGAQPMRRIFVDVVQ